VQVHRFVGAILVNPEGKVLLQLRTRDAPYYPNCWTLPGGKVEENETLEQALKREIKEELGINLVNFKLFKQTIQRKGNSIVKRIIYWSNLDKKPEELTLEESSALKYFSESEITSLKIAFSLKGIIQSFFKNPPKG